MCVFCKIVDGEIPSYRVYEDEMFVAILDISQATIGHTLLIPKKHVDNVFGLTEEQQVSLGATLVKVAKAVKKGTGAPALNILNNNGALAGQTVEHFHIHMIPRYEDDTVEFHFENHMNSLTKNDYTGVQEKIKSAF